MDKATIRLSFRENGKIATTIACFRRKTAPIVFQYGTSLF